MSSFRLCVAAKLIPRNLFLGNFYWKISGKVREWKNFTVKMCKWWFNWLFEFGFQLSVFIEIPVTSKSSGVEEFLQALIWFSVTFHITKIPLWVFNDGKWNMTFRTERGVSSFQPSFRASKIKILALLCLNEPCWALKSTKNSKKLIKLFPDPTTKFVLFWAQRTPKIPNESYTSFSHPVIPRSVKMFDELYWDLVTFTILVAETILDLFWGLELIGFKITQFPFKNESF